MLEKALEKYDIHFCFPTMIERKKETTGFVYFTESGAQGSKLDEFAKALVDLSERYGVARAYHIPTHSARFRKIIEEDTPSVKLVGGIIQILGASSPTDYLHVVADAVEKELLNRADAKRT